MAEFYKLCNFFVKDGGLVEELLEASLSMFLLLVHLSVYDYCELDISKLLF